MSIPCEVLFEKPEYTNVKLSFDGKSIYYIKNVDNKKQLIKYDLETEKQIIINQYEENIINYGWFDPETFYILSDQNNNLQMNNLAIERNGIQKKISIENANIRILTSCERVKDKIIFASNHEKRNIFNLYELDLYSMSYNKIYENTEETIKWFFSKDNKITFKYNQKPDNMIFLYFLYNEEWILLREYKLADLWRSHIIFYNDNIIMLFERYTNNTFSIVKLDIKDKFKEKLLFNYNYDISSVFCFDEKILAVGYHADRLEWEILSSDYNNDLITMLDKKYGDIQNWQVNEARDKFLLTFTNDTKPKSYYIYDRNKKEMRYLFKSRKTLDNYKLSPQESINYISFDNVQIHGYITKPSTIDNNTLLVKIHGGPTQRDNWEFNVFTQFFASMGCHILQINYRGSFGYGNSFEKLLYKEIGGTVTNDIFTGISYILSLYPFIENIFLFGWSSGGYISLMTGINHLIPKLKGIIALSAPLVIEQFIDSVENAGIQKKNSAYEIFGNLETDKDVIEKQSVINNINILIVPIIYSYGHNDNIINKEFVNICKNKYSKFIEYGFSNDGHFINNTKNRIFLFNKIKEFIKEYSI